MLHPKCYDLRAKGLTPDEALEVATELRKGAIIIYPTDTLYAVGCCALDAAAVALLREAKGREAFKPFPVIVADLAQARSLAVEWPPAARALAETFWPGPLTLVVPAERTLPNALIGSATSVAVRVPQSAVARDLARLAGPLVATSANLAGEPPCLNVFQALRAFPAAVLALDVGPLDGAPSTIVSVDGPASGFKILRNGRLDRRTVEEVLDRSQAGRGDEQP